MFIARVTPRLAAPPGAGYELDQQAHCAPMERTTLAVQRHKHCAPPEHCRKTHQPGLLLATVAW